MKIFQEFWSIFRKFWNNFEIILKFFEIFWNFLNFLKFLKFLKIFSSLLMHGTKCTCVCCIYTNGIVNEFHVCRVLGVFMCRTYKRWINAFFFHIWYKSYYFSHVFLSNIFFSEVFLIFHSLLVSAACCGKSVRCNPHPFRRP